MMKFGFYRLIVAGVTLLCWGKAPVQAQQPFYQDKTIRLIVGTAAGGGFDTYSRVIARHMGRHIPGNPTIVVDNMPGAAHLVSANYLYNVAKPDGLTIGNFTGALLLGQVLKRPGIEFDARKFSYLGAPARDISVCAVSKRSGLRTLQEWQASKKPVKIGGIGPGDFTYEVPKVLAYALNLPTQVVAGYKGTAAIRLAVESDEVDGVCMDWNSIRSTWRKALDAGEVAVVTRLSASSDPEISNLPLASDFAKKPDGRTLIQVAVAERGSIFRSYLMPPGVARDRVQVLTRAFQETLRDSEFLSDAKKSNLNIDPVSSTELEEVVTNMCQLKPELLAKLSEILR
ncbi:MAG TPA: tripartite tricarboxylate transporter substrate-binding protein [Candidatus Eisenbacteria bacterium]|nr:tripartite tricarboxylate transporter substrate-binding protein [Candidatus Eisenbacteria bacterium]